jgi:hypothetical protein
MAMGDERGNSQPAACMSTGIGTPGIKTENPVSGRSLVWNTSSCGTR